jgi:predicted lipoprotein with Yx(FWY)xxD motif
MEVLKNISSDRLKVFFVAILTVIGFGFMGCSDDSTGPDEDEDYLQVTSTQSHGNILADADGNALYFFARDVNGVSRCEGDCLANWPVFHSEDVESGNGIEIGDVGSITRADGSSQTTYRGWPLYYFTNDNEAGEINGDGANGVWFVAKPDYSLMVANGQLVGEDGNNYTSNYEIGEENTTYFTDAEGRTIYSFAFDAANTNNFTAEDFSNNGVWPIYYTDIESLPAGLDEQNFGEISVHGEEQQLTYKGWPLYYFGQDTERGDTKGVSFPNPGIWPIVNMDVQEAPEPE